MELGRTKFIDLARVPVYVTVKLGGSKVGTLCGLRRAATRSSSSRPMRLASRGRGRCAWRPVVAAAAGSPGDAAREWRSPPPAVPSAPK